MASLRRDCLRTMAEATDYRTWHDAALELDRFEGLEEWRQDEISPHYDFELIRARRERLRQRRQQQDVKAARRQPLSARDRHRLRDDDVGAERQVRAMCFDRASRQDGDGTICRQLAHGLPRQ